MNRPPCIVLSLLIVAYMANMASAEATSAVVAPVATTSAIARVERMPNCPQPYSMRDWSQTTRDYLDSLFDFDRQGPHLPLVNWTDESRSMVTMPAFVGGPNDAEAINFLAAVVSGSLVGIDMRNFRGHDWVTMGENFFNSDEGVYVNRLGGHTGKSFWYDIFPNVLFYQVNNLYPGNSERDKQAVAIAEKWHDACVALGGRTGPLALPNFDHTGFKLASMRPVDGDWIEPEAAAGIAWLEYMAWVKSKDSRFLTAADWCIRALEQRPIEQSPLYEVLLPYGALAAARMNAELERDYDVAKLVNDCFEPRRRPQARPGWGVIADRWDGLDAHGLVGSATDGEGYAFAMNTYEWAGALVPLARYDTRYARDIGKWTLNLANAARLFYADAHDAEHQSSYDWSKSHDAKTSIAYEGIRKWKRGASTALADHSTAGGNIVQGSFMSTQFRRETPPDVEVLEEDIHSGVTFEHVWELDLPDAENRWLVVAAEHIDGGHGENEFCFSFAEAPVGPYARAFTVSAAETAQVAKLPQNLQGKLYVKAHRSDQSKGKASQDQLAVDAIAISYRSNIGPFAQGDALVSFIDLLDESTAPIVLYRPTSAVTDLGLYGSSHVGVLGGIVKTTNVERILQLDLLKTDYYHAEAYATYLYYNPHASVQTVAIDVGSEAKDIYDAVSDRILETNARGLTNVDIPGNTARVVVLAPAGGEMRKDGKRTLINNVIVRFTD